MTSMARAWASLDWKFISGMIESGTMVGGDWKCLMCQLKTVIWSETRLEKSNPSACLSPPGQIRSQLCRRRR